MQILLHLDSKISKRLLVISYSLICFFGQIIKPHTLVIARFLLRLLLYINHCLLNDNGVRIVNSFYFVFGELGGHGHHCTAPVAAVLNIRQVSFMI